MNGFIFQHPEVFWALPALGVLLALWRVLRRPLFATIGIAPLLSARAHRASRLRRAPALLAGAALVTIVFALMDPIVPYSESQVESRGVDIALVLDLSTSMQEAMTTGANAVLRPTRLEVTKKALSDFIARRPDDRIGMLVFSDSAYVLSPLTIDHAALHRHVAMIDARTLEGEGMTAIGEGLALANSLLVRQRGRDESREGVIVILTDGENTAGREPVQAAEEALDAGNQIYLVGVDLEDEIKRRPEVVRLINVVERRGGRYFTADNAGQLAEAARGIDSLERGMLVSTRYTYNTPAFESLAGLAIVLMCAALLLRAVPFFVDFT
jgi:Ca-activated chloride channel family protein